MDKSVGEGGYQIFPLQFLGLAVSKKYVWESFNVSFFRVLKNIREEKAGESRFPVGNIKCFVSQGRNISQRNLSVFQKVGGISKNSMPKRGKS